MPEMSTTAASKPRSFVTLDFLRGVAALPVLYLHTSRLFGNRPLFPHGYLAVDFFFLLSGFVMTYVYQERLDTGWSSAEFFKVRILRLYPLYFAGFALGTLFAVLWAHYGGLQTRPSDLAILLLLGAFLVPAPPPPLLPTAAIAAYPFDVPAWSLFYELIGNLVHAVFLRRRSVEVLISVAVVFSVISLLVDLHYGRSFGPDRADYLLGPCRVLFAYPMGIILYRVWEKGKLQVRVPPVVIAALLLAALAVPVRSTFFALYEWLIVTVIFPILILFGAHAVIVGPAMRVAREIGALSYPLYILHVPIFDFFEQVWKKLTKHAIQQDAPWSGVVFLLLLLPITYWMGKLFDPEVRKLLHTRVLPLASRVARLFHGRGSR